MLDIVNGVLVEGVEAIIESICDEEDIAEEIAETVIMDYMWT